MSAKLGFFSGAVPTWSPEEVAAATAQAGFEGIEWEVRKGEGHIRLESAVEDGAARRRDGESHGLRVCCVSANHLVSVLDEQSVEWLVAAAGACGAPVARVFAPPFDDSRDVCEQLQAVRGALMRHAASFDEHGVALVIELSEETLLPSPELLLRTCEGIDSRAVGALYDPANMLVEGNLPPGYVTALLGDYLRHVHIKNEVFVNDPDRGWVPTIVRADEGLVNWRLVFEELRRVRYDGWIVIDHLSGEPSVDRIVLEREIAKELWAGALQ